MPGSRGKSSWVEQSRAESLGGSLGRGSVASLTVVISLCTATTCRNRTILSCIVAVDRSISKWLGPEVTFFRAFSESSWFTDRVCGRTFTFLASCQQRDWNQSHDLVSFSGRRWRCLKGASSEIYSILWCSDFVCVWPKDQLKARRTIFNR